MKLGESTNTLDSTGTITDRSIGPLPLSHFDQKKLEGITSKFIGSDILQVPPKYFSIISFLDFLL